MSLCPDFHEALARIDLSQFEPWGGRKKPEKPKVYAATRVDWEAIRSEVEDGMSLTDASKKFGVCMNTIRDRATRQEWDRERKWRKIRVAYEMTDATTGAISSRFGVSSRAIQFHAATECWTRRRATGVKR